MTVRQVFYQATVRGLVEKTEAGYGKVQSDLTVLRKDETLPYWYLADNTRWQNILPAAPPLVVPGQNGRDSSQLRLAQ